MSEPFKTDMQFRGMAEGHMDDETILALVEGCCEELELADYASLGNLTAPVVSKAYKLIELVYGQVGPAWTQRYRDVTTTEGKA